MAKQRYINTHFWDDTFIVDLESDEKLLFLYALTNPLTNISGAYEISIRRIIFDTGLEKDRILSIFEKFTLANKIIYKDGWLLIANFIKNQSLNPKIQSGIESALSDCPDWIKDRLSIAYHSLSHLNLNSNRDSNRDSNTSVLGENASPVGESVSPPTNVKPPKKIKVIDERNKHPAIVMVHQIFTRYPHKDLWERIIREIGDSPDTEFFQASYELWRSVNGNPANLEKWLFEPNKKKALPEIYGKENGNGAIKTSGSKYPARRTDADNFRESADFYNDPNNFAN